MIVIRRATMEELPLIGKVEDRRLDSERVLVRLKGSGFALDYQPLPNALWRIEDDGKRIPGGAEAWIASPDRDVYLAWLDDTLAGRMFVEVHENNLARVRDVCVQLSMRRRGVGDALLAMAEEWAKSKRLSGLLAEAKDGNAGACQFLTTSGFALGGVDTLRYAAQSQQTLQAAGLRENALFFYRFIKRQEKA